MDKLGPNSANSSPLTPLGFLERSATVYGNLPSIIYNTTTYTWSQTHQRCLRLASSLCSLGISPGDVVSVLAPNIPAMYEMHFGVPMSGAVLNTINLRLDARTISILLRHSGSKILFVDPPSQSLADDVIRLFPADQTPPRLIPIEDPYESSGSSYDSLSYEKMIENGDPDFRWIRPRSDWSPMILNYTSGTTSSPKGVVHCHRGLFIITLDSIIDWSVPKNPMYLWTLPMFHANGWSFPWGVAAMGGTNVCLRKFDAATIYTAISTHEVTHLCGAPVVLNMLANAPDTARRPLPNHTVHILTAGAPPPAPVLYRAEALGFSISHGYGLTETAGLAVSCAWKGEWDRLPADERARMKARQGVRTVGMAEADVVDGASGKSVARDGSTMGEIVLRGGCIMLGYLKDEEGTKKAIRPDGWFYTGDVGVMHPNGYIEIRDRSKDVIISGGENLSSVEVESILYGHPAIDEAAVVARADEYWGETPCAFISLRDGKKATEGEIIGWCRERMPHYMVPKTVIFKPELPKTSTGKIQKYILRNMAKELGPLASAPPRKSRM